MAAPLGKLLYLYVGTSDFDRDLKYYTDVLGASVLWNHHAFGAKVAALRLCDGPQYLLADHRSAPSCLPLFEVQDLKAKAKELRSRGWKSAGRSFEVPPRTVPALQGSEWQRTRPIGECATECDGRRL